MSESMVERVAVAIENAIQVWAVGIPQGESRKPDYRGMARAAIEAMREPTDDQRNEYFRIRKFVGETDIAATFVDDMWECAIDAALLEAKS